MQIVDNTYQVADGYFISNFIGASEFAAENLIFPPLAIVASIGLMFGSGASALISYERGKGDEARGNRLLSMLMLVLLAVSAGISALLFALIPTISRLVGTSESMIPYCVDYGRILAGFMPFMMLNMAFHPLLVAAERPGLGFAVSVVNAVVNIALDGLFVAVLGWGLTGAAIATGIAWLVSALIPCLFFLRAREGLRFGRPRMDDVSSMREALLSVKDQVAWAIAHSAYDFMANTRQPYVNDFMEINLQLGINGDEMDELPYEFIELTDPFSAAGARLELELLENEYKDGGYDSEMEYAEGMYEPGRMEAFHGLYIQILESIVTGGDAEEYLRNR